MSQSKMFRLPRNKKQTYRLKSRPLTLSPGLILAMTLILNFHIQTFDLLYLMTDSPIATKRKMNVSSGH